MKHLSSGMSELVASFDSLNSKTKQAYRTAKVNEVWKNAIEAIYHDKASLILDHINAVYVIKASDIKDSRVLSRVEKGDTVLVVYADDSIVRTDLDARQELIRIKLNEQGEHIGAFSIKASRFDMKNRHPFHQEVDGILSGHPKYSLRELLPEEKESIHHQVQSVENPVVRDALEKAFLASIARVSLSDD